MKLSQFTDKFIFTTKIDLGDGEYLVLREPSTAELTGLSDDEKQVQKHMEKIFPKCIVESSFENENGEPATGQEIYDAIRESGSLFTEVLGKWLESVPFQQRLSKNTK